MFSIDSASTLQFRPAVTLDVGENSAMQRRIRSRAECLAVRHLALTADVATTLECLLRYCVRQRATRLG